MSVEQVARDFISEMSQPDNLVGYLTPDAMVDGGVLPQALPAREATKIVEGIKTALPDLHFDIKHVDVNGDRATVDTVWSGTQSGFWNLPIPGMQPIPPSGKWISVKDTFIVTVQGDKVSHMTVVSPADGGIPAALAQIGVEVPRM